MGDYQEYSVSFECEKKKLREMIKLCDDIGLDIDEKEDASKLTNGWVAVNKCEADTASYGFIDELKKLKKQLIESGAKDVSVKHSWPNELTEVEDK